MKTIGLSLVLVALVTSGCGSMIQSKACKKGIDVVSTGVSQALECKRPDKVAASVKEIAASVKLCDQVGTGPFADALCPHIVPPVVNAIFDKPIPAEWECKATVARERVNDFVIDLCKKIPVNEQDASVRQTCESLYAAK